MSSQNGVGHQSVFGKIRTIRGAANVPGEVQSQAVACLVESPHLEVPDALKEGRERLQRFVESRQEE